MVSTRFLLLFAVLSTLIACDTDAEKAGPTARGRAPDAVASAPAGASVPPTAFTEYTSPLPSVQHSYCAMDLINGTPASEFDTDPAGNAIFEGWATKPGGGLPAKDIRIVLMGEKTYAVAGTTGLTRQDVAAAVGAGAAESGFRVVVPVLGLPRGTYAARIEAVDGSFYCKTGARIVVN